ncbi:MAG: class D sortase [Clostridia bacterium]|nr:class D sortase [Clostridia bacterium]
MKKKLFRRAFILMLLSLIIIVLIILFLKIRFKVKEEKLVKIAEDIIQVNEDEKTEKDNNETNIDVISKSELNVNENIIGILEIPKLNIKAPIKEGTSEKILREAVGHFSNSSFWNGNVGLASHNRGNLVAHYFEKINQLVIGDEIIYKTKFGERRYKVEEIKEIKSTDWSIITQTSDNIITLITCIKSKPNLRLCVKAVEK